MNNKGERSESKVRKIGLLLLLFVVFITVFIFIGFNLSEKPEKENTGSEPGVSQEEPQEIVPEIPKEEPNVHTSITVSAAGDFTLGTDEAFAFNGSFTDEAQKNGLGHFTKGLNNIFKDDDFTTVNLETTLTTAEKKAEKKFRFKGDPAYAQILKDAGIESVNLANNHIFDYLQQGYDDTVAVLQKNNIGYFGYENAYVTTVKDIKIGALGYEGWRDTPELRLQVSEDISELKAQGVQIILVHYHWGVERSYVPLESQRTLAQFTIDSGADLILGHHPHVVQGIEEYKDKFIVYSLGNFMFGGNRNPSDKDTFVFQQTFKLIDGQLTDEKEINIVPFSISSLKNRNDYRPTMLTGEEANRVKQKIIDVSNQINGTDWLVHEKGTSAQ